MGLFNWMFGGGERRREVPEGVIVVPRDARRTQAFLSVAQQEAEHGNFEIAIERYISALRYDPTNMGIHEELLTVARKRQRVRKPRTQHELAVFGGQMDVVGKMILVAERAWAFSPGDPDRVVEFMARTGEAHVPEQGFDMREVMAWAADLIMCGVKFDQPVTVGHLNTITDLLFVIGDYKGAVKACGLASSRDKTNAALQQRLKDLETELAFHESQREPSKPSLNNAHGPRDEPGGRRIIKTARTTEAINAGAKAGFFPMVLPVVPSPEIHSRVFIYQDEKTGEVTASGDLRGAGVGKFLGGFQYYPHQFPCPFAAYLIPKDMARGEEVWLEDLIEDVVGGYWNQGESYRLNAAPAVWTGERFVVLFDPKRNARQIMG